MLKNILYYLWFLYFLFFSSCCYGDEIYANSLPTINDVHFITAPTAPVHVYARNFVFGGVIDNAKITMLEDPSFFMITDSHGRIAFNWPIGHNITLILNKWDYVTTQTGTVTIPPQGLIGEQHELTFQIPDIVSFELLSAILPGKLDSSCCHIATTVCARNMTLKDDPQGEPNTTLSLKPDIQGVKPFYFGIIFGKTNPFARGLNSTSLDGGVLFFNVPIGQYLLVPHKPGVVFGDPAYSVITCAKEGTFINASPPWGPRVK